MILLSLAKKKVNLEQFLFYNHGGRLLAFVRDPPPP